MVEVFILVRDRDGSEVGWARAREWKAAIQAYPAYRAVEIKRFVPDNIQVSRNIQASRMHKIDPIQNFEPIYQKSKRKYDLESLPFRGQIYEKRPIL